MLRKLFKGEIPNYTFEKRFLTSVGEIKWGLLTASIATNSSGEVIYGIGMVKDITEQKKARLAIKASEMRLSLIFNNTTDFMALIRVERNRFIIESVNQAFENLMEAEGIELKKEELEGMHVGYCLRQVLNLTDKAILFHFDKYAEAIRNKKPIQYLESGSLGNQRIYSETTLSPIIEDNEVTHLLWISRNITELRMAHQKLEIAFKEVNRLKSQLEHENTYLRDEIKLHNNYENIIYYSKDFQEVIAQVESVAATDATVLIQGETGTGKELIARAIHNLSSRKNRPMIKLNCAAIPKGLMESELFGHERGAFTGAIKKQLGKFELADKSTLFLDEIGELSMELQPKLFRALQEGEIGSIGEPMPKKVDVRIIAASNKDLKHASEKGTFRKDLYFRLNVFPITIPPLRERKEDISLLVEHFIKKFSTKHVKKVEFISNSTMEYLKNYHWPGNVRELENLVERSVILSDDQYLHMPETGAGDVHIPFKSEDSSVSTVLRNHILKVLKECDWKIEGNHGAATVLEVKPSTLRDRMKKLRIHRPSRISRNSVEN